MGLIANMALDLLLPQTLKKEAKTYFQSKHDGGDELTSATKTNVIMLKK